LRSGIAGWVLLCVAGCAHVKASSDRVLVFPPVVITAGNIQDRELAQLNASELLAKGRAAFGAQDYATAAKCFSRGADFYPDSPLHEALSYNAGLALLQQHEWAQALERFKVLAEPKAGQGTRSTPPFRKPPASISSTTMPRPPTSSPS
jgi:tetratricopeptide (TPR) repeat protein